MALEQRPTYTKDQITKYFDRLKLPEADRKYDVSDLKQEEALDYLALLQKLHLAEIPFENLEIHYSPHRQISIHTEALFDKIIGSNNGRGGYCMENNALFGTLLYSLHYTLYSAAGRVFEVRWTGFGHMINLVAIGGTKYHVDVGFGSDSPTRPMPLESGMIHPQMKPGSTRLNYRNISENVDPNQRLWVYEYRKNDDSEWEQKYCFSELEFLPQDYNVLNYFTSTNRATIFTKLIMVVKKVMRDGELVGNMILVGNSLKWRIDGEKGDEIEFKSESERLEALEKHFGMKFGEIERDSIRGLVTEIK